jgi:uncharacterized membrane protein YbhN (UPF0104 family)
LIERLRNRRAGLALMAALTLAALWFFWYRFREAGFRPDLFWATFAGVHWGWIGAATAFILLTYVGRALRWEIMLRPLCRRASLWSLTDATIIGFTAVVLFGRAGELVRPYLISQRVQVPFSSQVGIWLLERIYDFLVVLLIFGVALSQVRASSAALGPNMRLIMQIGGSAVGIAGVACLIVLVALAWFSDASRQRILSGLAVLPPALRSRAQNLVLAFSEGVRSTRSPLFVLLLVTYTVLEWAMIAGSYFCLFRSLPVTGGFSAVDVVIVLGFISLASAIQVPGIGGGVQVAAVVVLTELYGFPLETATSLALLIWLLSFVVIVPLGLLLAFREGLNWTKLKHLEEDTGL